MLKLYISYFFSVLIVCASLLLAYWAFNEPQGLLIVHFDPFKGIDFLGTRRDVFGIGITGVAAITVNILLSRYLYLRDRFLSWTLAAGTLAFSILVFIAIATIVSNN